MNIYRLYASIASVTVLMSLTVSADRDPSPQKNSAPFSSPHVTDAYQHTAHTKGKAPAPVHQASRSTAPSLPPQRVASRQIWNLKNADIRAVIQTVSVLTGKSFVIDPRVQGHITFLSQHPMTSDEIYHAFLSILHVLGYAAVTAGPVVKILPLMEVKVPSHGAGAVHHPASGEEITVRVVKVQHGSVIHLMSVLRNMIQPWGSISAYLPTNSVILVDTAQNIRQITALIERIDHQAEYITTVIPLKYGIAKNITLLLESLFNNSRARGQIVSVSFGADEHSNSILVYGSLTDISRLHHLIAQLDKPVAHDGDTEVIALNYLNAKKLAPILAKIGSGAVRYGPRPSTSVAVQAEEDSNAVIIHAPRSILHNLIKVVKQLDKRPDQVLVEAIIVKVSQTLMDQLGVIWGTSSTKTTTDESGKIISSDTTTHFDPPNEIALRVTPSLGFMPGIDLAVLIRALQGNTATHILATPSIVVLNNKTASISEGKNIGIINREYSTGNTGSTTDNQTTPFNTVQRQDVTLSLKVTPQISPNHMIHLKIEQKDNSVDTTTTSSDNPVLHVSTIKTDVLVPSGDILVLGGLVNDGYTESEQKVPLLGDIPLLGHLFRYRSHQIEKQNLMVFIKPVILDGLYDHSSTAESQTKARYHYMRSQESMMRRRHHKQQSPDISTMSSLPSYAELKRRHMALLPSPQATQEQR